MDKTSRLEVDCTDIVLLAGLTKMEDIAFHTIDAGEHTKKDLLLQFSPILCFT